MMLQPSENFWNLSLMEFYLATEGFIEFHAGKQQEDPLSKDELEELMELHPD